MQVKKNIVQEKEADQAIQLQEEKIFALSCFDLLPGCPSIKD